MSPGSQAMPEAGVFASVALILLELLGGFVDLGLVFGD